ncbi:DUF309 domain-containing protein [Thermoactinomyces sp. CICC 23799]|nr:DUF309 domain-containing protein [Thermoactinomyces sp. CICC 23799]MBH8601764.1 DUF309 domain-containing protein [Thermoactinomyces sp. CICC 23799]
MDALTNLRLLLISSTSCSRFSLLGVPEFKFAPSSLPFFKGVKSVEPYSPLYIAFFHYFNTVCDYYVCHDVLEELWLEEGREPYYQGLLQVAVGLYHLQNDNRNGALKLLSGALEKLSLYPEKEWMGIHLDRLKRDVKKMITFLNGNALPDATPERIVIELTDPVLRKEVAGMGNPDH